VNGGRFRAAGAGRQCAPAALGWRFWAAPQLHRYGAPMYRVASALLAILVLASRTASGAPPPDRLIQNPTRFLEGAGFIILVHVEELKPPFEGATGSSSEHATVRVIKSWKGPYAVGRILHVQPPVVVSCHDPCKSYVFRPDDQKVLIVGYHPEDRDPIVAWGDPAWTWPAVESQALMNALDGAVIQCPSCAKPPMPSR
jgi:hypothetical protein